MMRLACTGLSLALASVACGQTVELVYTSSNSRVSQREYFAYDYATGAATRIDSLGRIRTVSPAGAGATGQAGAATLAPAEHLSFRNAMRMASVVMPQLIVNGIESDPRAALLSEPEISGGRTYSGEFPTGQRLRSIEEFGNAIEVPSERVYFDLDESGRLVQLRYENSDRVQRFDLAAASTASLSYVRSFSDGAWVLADVRITDKSDRDVFRPEYITELARTSAMELASEIAESERARAATPRGRRAMEEVRDRSLGKSSFATTRLAVVLTGITLVAVGAFAWWKRR